jgi:hypothetical protein
MKATSLPNPALYSGDMIAQHRAPLMRLGQSPDGQAKGLGAHDRDHEEEGALRELEKLEKEGRRAAFEAYLRRAGLGSLGMYRWAGTSASCTSVLHGCRQEGMTSRDVPALCWPGLKCGVPGGVDEGGGGVQRL